jgi:hypothetical protein
MSYEDRSAIDLFFTDGDFGHFAEDRNIFTEKSHDEEQEQPWQAPTNYDGTLQTYANEIPKMEEHIAQQEANGGGIAWGDRAELAGTKAGHFFQDLFD